MNGYWAMEIARECGGEIGSVIGWASSSGLAECCSNFTERIDPINHQEGHTCDFVEQCAVGALTTTGVSLIVARQKPAG